MSGFTVADALVEARARGVDRLDAQLLLARALARPRAWLIANDGVVLDATQTHAYLDELARRASGEPLAYIVGEKEFHGLALEVNSDVLVPRADTETLVDWALELLRGPLAAVGAPRVVDLGTGSGAIALAVKHGAMDAQVCAVDASAAALEVAQRNVQRFGLDVRLLCSHWWDALAGQRFDLALSNPPYVAEGDAHLADLRHEPAMALAAGVDGLDAIRQIVAHAIEHLEIGGWLLLEHGHDQAASVSALLARAGFSGINSRRDLAGVLRCSGGFVPATAQG
ncbi:MAG: peptide chain release factor N(5)-glutamine methyltransferase [Betaproteobacteria bacterium]|nr:MAG: peptide chain release factor N(5)-glutamine methyltransferase [Betaproteobacteria bacterium]TMH33565.1 MAG: peptide chain release factor N(5)-glutamine methyltransferase [Betaproteobacteria bacterium]